MTVYPSGEQHEIGRGRMRATVVEVGGGLRDLHFDANPIVDGFPIDEMCHDGRGDVLVPWPNRLAGGRYTFDGRTNQLPLTEADRGHAIHGLVRWARWEATAHSEDAVTMEYRLYPSPGYPHMLDLAVTYELGDDGLTVTMRAVNRGTDRCPFGAGQHPYVMAGGEFVNSATLTVPASSIYRYDDGLIPLERVAVEGTELDFRTPHTIGDTVINMDYTDLQRDSDGRARVILEAPDLGRRVEVWMDEAFKHVTIYTGETVQPPNRRRTSVAVEPMTCPPNAFVSGEDLLVLEPGESWQGMWGIAVRD